MVDADLYAECEQEARLARRAELASLEDEQRRIHVEIKIEACHLYALKRVETVRAQAPDLYISCPGCQMLLPRPKPRRLEGGTWRSGGVVKCRCGATVRSS